MPLLFLLPLLTSVLCQQPQAPFRSGVQVVEVDARVFDKDGRFVTDLTLDDFEVLEDGVTQQIRSLYLVGSPVAPGADPSAQPSAATPAPPESTRQTWIFVFDLNHLTPGGGFERARKAVEEFIRDRFTEGDLAGVVAGSTMVNNRLTSVREELVAAVKGVKPNADLRSRQIELTREWPRFQSVDEAIGVVQEQTEVIRRVTIRACTDDPDMCLKIQPDAEVRRKARVLVEEMQRSTMETLSAINGLASGLAKMQGPKTVVLISDGFVIDGIESTLRSVVGQVARAGARVYAIDARGLNRGRGAGIIDQMLADDGVGAPVQFDAQENGPNSLAVDTGGAMIRNENNVGRALDEIARDSGRYYVLGYQPSNTTFDGKYRPIQVRVKRPGLRARARRGYLALEPSRMLAPTPIKTTPAAATPAPSPIPEAAAPVAGIPVPVAPPVTPAAPVEAPAPAPAAGAVRMRPGAEARVRGIAGEGAGKGEELASKGWEAYQRGDVEAALTALTEAAAQPNARPWVWYTLGMSQVALGRPVEAIASWERVRESAPDFDAVYMDLADAYVQLSDLTDALKVLRAAESRWPKSPDVHNAIGVIAVRRGAVDEAVGAFEKAIAVAPEDSLGYFNLARAYEMRYDRSRHYVSSQRRWTASEGDRRKAAENYQRYIALGGPYVEEARAALSRLDWR